LVANQENNKRITTLRCFPCPPSDPPSDRLQLNRITTPELDSLPTITKSLVGNALELAADLVTTRSVLGGSGLE
jgi:hypothetical protein